MIKYILVGILALVSSNSFACTSAIVSAQLTKNGRVLMWKNRDTNDQNNRIKRIPAHDGKFGFVALFDSRDRNDTAAWTGFNDKGFAIMNTAVYNLKNDSVVDMDKEGVVMKKALEVCATVNDFERLLKTLPKPLGVEANFGVIDAKGNGAYFETGNYSYTKYDLKDATDGILMRTNYAHSGRKDDGSGYIREQNEFDLLQTHIEKADFTPDVFTEELSRTFYNSQLGVDYTHSGKEWIVDQDFIPRRISTATVVIEGVMSSESPALTMMWTGLGYVPCSEIYPVWNDENGVPDCLIGVGDNNVPSAVARATSLKERVFPIKRGNGSHYIHLSELYNKNGNGICQILVPNNIKSYEAGYKERELRAKCIKTQKDK